MNKIIFMTLTLKLVLLVILASSCSGKIRVSGSLRLASPDSAQSNDSGSSSPTPGPAQPAPPAISYSVVLSSDQTLITGQIGTSSLFQLNVSNTGSDIENFALSNPSPSVQIVSTNCPSTFAAGASCSATYKVIIGAKGAHIQVFTSSGTGLSGSSFNLNIDGNVDLNVTVNPLYPTNGANWNDYVNVTNTAISNFEQSDSPCVTGSLFLHSGCLHGGVLKKISMGEISSCDGHTLEEDLGVLRWQCMVIDGKAAFYSMGLKEDRHLSHLLNATSWKNNFVTLYYHSQAIGSSTPTTWWSNTVSALPDNSAGNLTTLSTPSVVYTLSSSRASGGYNIDADKIAITMLNGAKLNFNGAAANNCNDSFGPGSDGKCLLVGGYNNYLWIEGYFSGTTSTGGSNTNFAVINMYQNVLLHFRNVQVTGSSGTGLNGECLQTSHNYSSFYEYLTIFNCSDRAIYTKFGSGNSVWRKIKLFNNADSGYIRLYATGNKEYFSDILSVSNGTLGMPYIVPASDKMATVHRATLVNNTSYALATDTGGMSFSNILSFANNSMNNFDLYITFTTAKLANLALSYLNESMTSSPFVGSTIFTTDLQSKGFNCNINGGVGPGLDSNCDIINASTALITKGIDFQTNVFGKVTTDEVLNSSDTNGTATYPAAPLSFDWTNFSNDYMAWGKSSSSSWTDTANFGRCSSGTCAIWDYSLDRMEAKIRNTSNDGQSENQDFLAGEVCPNAVDGGKVSQSSASDTYLINASEIFNDNIGDDDGLCESNEDCLYNPNYGAYQGHGDFTTNGTCLFQDGAISGVRMYAHPNNGY